ncbi:MAG: hypothetical protein QNJ31_05465 [Candidatus Caenarcaniphilales bacterium]|nr:hypothetical protein [Candidatus Caenarcaniphilales bacterium]
MTNIDQINAYRSVDQIESTELDNSYTKKQSQNKTENTSFKEQLETLSDESNLIVDNLQGTETAGDLTKQNELFAEPEFDNNDLEQFMEESNAQSKFIATLNKQLDVIPQKVFDAQSLSDKFLHARVQELYHSKSANAIGNEPILDFDKQNMKVSIEFPMLEDLKSLTVQYDPSTRSIAAEMLTSQEVSKLIQNQVAQLERNLLKHDIKLQELKISSTHGNSPNHERQNQQQQSRQQSKQKG